MSRDDVKRLTAIFVDRVRGRVPVIAGIIPDSSQEAGIPLAVPEHAGRFDAESSVRK